MSCKRVQDRLILYLAGELSPVDQAKIRVHLQQCVCCSAVATDLAQTQSLVEGAVQTAVRVPTTLDSRVMQCVRTLPARPPLWERLHRPIVWSRRWAFASVAILFLLGGLAVAMMNSGTSEPAGSSCGMVGPPVLDIAGLRSTHTSCMSDCEPVLVSGSDPTVVAQRLSRLLGFYVYPADLRPSGAVLVEGRKCQQSGVPLAMMAYTWGSKRISVFQIQSGAANLPVLKPAQSHGRSFLVDEDNGFACVAWHAGKVDVLFIAPAGLHDLLDIAASARGFSASPARSI